MMEAGDRLICQYSGTFRSERVVLRVSRQASSARDK